MEEVLNNIRSGVYVLKKKEEGQMAKPQVWDKFSEAIVFVVGGGNYIEYQNLVDYTKSKQGRKVVYGCSELFNAAQFIKQLSQLSQK